MRTLILATAGFAAMALASPAAAQHAGHSGGNGMAGGNGQWHGDSAHGGGQWHGGGRNWGGKIGGRWIGGARAPGGWGGYRRPVRGWSLPRYWVSPGFYISDWGNYGLSQPPYGYNWSRYYDDAVLVDRYGRVMDSVGGLDWDGYGEDGYTDRGDDDYDYDHDVGPGAGYPPPPGGPGAYGYDGPPPPPPMIHQEAGCNCGGTIVNGYYYPGATTTTVTVTSVPVTTTTTEYIEESAPVVHHGVRKWHAAPRVGKHQTKVSHKVRCLC